MNVDLGDCFKFGLDRLQKNPAFYIVGYLLVLFIGGCTLGICAGPMVVGFFRGCSKEDQGQKAEIGDVFSGFNDFGPAFLAAFIGGLVGALGLCACCIGVFFTSSIPAVGVYFVAMGDKDGMNAFKKSLAIFQSNMVGIGVAALVCHLLTGLIITGPIGLAAYYRMSQQLASGGTPGSVPPGGMPGAMPPGNFPPGGGMPPPPGGMPPMGPPR